MFTKRIAFLLMTLLSLSFVSCSKESGKFVTIGTGGVTGVYYPTGGAISRMINSKSSTYGIKVTVESTAGSVYNINAVLKGDLEFGIAQSDRQYQAYKGVKDWEAKGPQNKLRSVFSIHPEAITLIASVSSGINELKDIVGKKINLGNQGSGHLANSLDILAACNLDEKDIAAQYIKAVESPGALQDGAIDAFFYTVGHPNGNIKESTSGRIKVRIIDLKGPEIENLIHSHSYYAHATILKDFYPSAVNTQDIPTLGVKATLVTSSEVNERTVYAITKEVFENLEEFKKLHPAYAVLTKKSMLAGLSAPLHRGAIKYFKEANLLSHVNQELLK